MRGHREPVQMRPLDEGLQLDRVDRLRLGVQAREELLQLGELRPDLLPLPRADLVGPDSDPDPEVGRLDPDGVGRRQVLELRELRVERADYPALREAARAADALQQSSVRLRPEGDS